MFDDERGQPTRHRNMKGAKILKSEVKAALAKMNRNKVTESDRIVINVWQL